MTRDIIQVHANKPVINAAINPKLKEKTSTLTRLKSSLKTSLAILPKIKGTTIKKEKRAAFSLSTPINTEVEIVAPDLDIPGKIAIA